MPFSFLSDRISAAAWRFLEHAAAAELKPWADAMRAELDAIENPYARLRWTCGCVWALAKTAMRRHVVKLGNERPWPVTVIAIFFAGFCCELVAVMGSQLIGHKIHGAWSEAAFPVAFCFLLVLLPGVIAAGLWLLDNAARLMAIFFALAHALLNWAWMNQPSVGYRTITLLRVVADILIILLLCHPAVRKAFQQQRIELRLGRTSDV
jgi:hypothetical protein